MICEERQLDEDDLDMMKPQWGPSLEYE
jgi:hypothetical protein